MRPGLWAPLPRLLLAMPISPCTVLFPRALLAETGPLDPALNGADDWYWALQLALAGHRFYALAEPLAEYRLHGANTVRKPDAMLPAWLGMLDRVYARPDLPTAARRVRSRAYYERHATAAAMYYGLGRAEAAAEQVRAAARVAPARVAGGRFLQSLIASDPGGPSRPAAQAAIEFVQASLRGEPLPGGWARRWRARAHLVLALQREGGVRRRLRDALRGAAA